MLPAELICSIKTPYVILYQARLRSLLAPKSEAESGALTDTEDSEENENGTRRIRALIAPLLLHGICRLKILKRRREKQEAEEKRKEKKEAKELL